MQPSANFFFVSFLLFVLLFISDITIPNMSIVSYKREQSWNGDAVEIIIICPNKSDFLAPPCIMGGLSMCIFFYAMGRIWFLWTKLYLYGLYSATTYGVWSSVLKWSWKTLPLLKNWCLQSFRGVCGKHTGDTGVCLSPFLGLRLSWSSSGNLMGCSSAPKLHSSSLCSFLFFFNFLLISSYNRFFSVHFNIFLLFVFFTF